MKFHVYYNEIGFKVYIQVDLFLKQTISHLARQVFSH